MHSYGTLLTNQVSNMFCIQMKMGIKVLPSNQSQQIY